MLEGSDSPVNVIVTAEGDALRVCGESTRSSDRVRSELSAVPAVSVPWTAPIDAALACGGQAGSTAVPSDVPDSQPGDDAAGLTGRRSSRWRDGDATDRVIVTQYETADLAAAAQSSQEDAYLNYAVIELDAGRVQNAHALRYLSQYMTSIQPLDAGDQSDVLLVRYDNTLAEITHGPVGEAPSGPAVVNIAMCVQGLLGL